jgi:uncharacterized protein (TIGR02145 family)
MKQIHAYIPIIILMLLCVRATSQNSDFLMDERDGNIYLVAKFNDTWWMCQNLKFDAGEGSICYENDETNCMLKGRLYNFESARRACPEGYHLPGDDEWKAMESYLGMNDKELDQNYNRNSGTVGKFLKMGGGLSFDADYVGMVNESGGGLFTDTRACFWTSTEDGDKYAWSRLIDKNKDGVDRIPGPKNNKLSVRCVKAAEPEEPKSEDPKDVRPD